MKSSIGASIAFILGAVAGGAAVWMYRRENYISLEQHEEEIASVKESYARHEERTETVPSVEPENKSEAAEYTRRVQTEGYTEYARTMKSRDKAGTSPSEPYVISPDEFGEIEEYTRISLTCFADGVLADEYGEEVDDVEEIIGDGLHHFGEYEEDSVFVRNDPKRCDYEILKDLRTFSAFLATLPPKHNGEG